MPSYHAILDIIGRTTVVYLFLLIGVRLSGKREVGQLMPFELVLLLVLSNAVQNAMVGTDTSLIGGLIAALVLLLLTRALSYIGHHSPRCRRVLVGAPTILVAHGLILHRNLERENLTGEDLLQILREHEVSKPEEVELATLEVDGNVSVIRRASKKNDHLFVRTRRRLRRYHRTP